MQFLKKNNQESKIFSILLMFMFCFILLLCNKVKAAGPHELASPPCYGIVGQGKIVAQGNSGILDFDFSKTYNLPNLEQYEACVRVDANGKPVRVEGWAWNPNLGWVSLYCSGGSNLGLSCGGQNYGVTFSFSPSYEPFGNVELRGYAWGDNIGYISFNCVNTGSCNSVNYKVGLIPSGSSKGAVNTSSANLYYAWADSVQWFDLSGVRFPWVKIVNEEVKICSAEDNNCSCNLAKGCVLVEDKMPIADGVDGIEVKLPFRQAGVPLLQDQVEKINSNNCVVDMKTNATTSGKLFGFCYRSKFFTNIDLDQTTRESQRETNTYNEEDRVVIAPGVEFGGGVFESDDLGSDYGQIDFEGYRSFKLKAFAPTSTGNIDRQSGFQNEKFVVFDDNQLNGYDPAIVGRNIFELRELKFMLFKFSSDGVSNGDCIVGVLDGNNCNPIVIGPINLPFKPPLRVDDVRMKKGKSKLNFIEAILDEDFDIEFNLNQQLSDGVKLNNTNVELISGLGKSQKDESIRGGEVLKFDFLQDGQNIYNNFSFDKASLNIVNSIKSRIYFQDSNADVAISDFSEVKPYLYSVVSYDLDFPDKNNSYQKVVKVKYFSGKLPMQDVGLLKNPVMSVIGSVFSSSNIFNKSTSVVIRSLGAVASNKFREELAKEVSKVLRGSGGVSSSSNVKVVGFNGGDFVFDPSGHGQPKKIGKDIYYVKGKDLIFECNNDDCKYAGKKTFIVEGGNVYLNSNLMPLNQPDKLGLIVFKEQDLSDRKNGNVYVESVVTDLINVNIYADGAMMTYVKSKGINRDSGEPIFNDDFERQELLGNQLVVVGSLSSANCIGCASINSPYDGYGLPANGSSSYATDKLGARGRAKAKTYDINYWRYYGPSLEICSDGVTIKDQQVKVLAQDPCDTKVENYDINATELFDPDNLQSNGDLVLFDNQNQKKAKKFSSDNSKFHPVIFIYKSSEGLPLFTREIDVNPVAAF